MQIDKEEIVEALEAGSEVESIYKPIHQKEGNEIRLMDKLEEKEHREEKDTGSHVVAAVAWDIGKKKNAH